MCNRTRLKIESGGRFIGFFIFILDLFFGLLLAGDNSAGDSERMEFYI